MGSSLKGLSRKGDDFTTLEKKKKKKIVLISVEIELIFSLVLCF